MRVPPVALALSAALILIVVLAGCRVFPDATVTYRPRATPTAPPSFGQALYVERCVLCHGARGEGQGKVGPSLSSQELLTTVTDEFLHAAIARGRVGTTMSAWEENGMTPAQIDSLVQYIRRWQTQPNVVLDARPAVGDRARGQELYTQFCVTCHGPDGLTGGRLTLEGTSIGHPEFLATASDAFIAYAIAHGRSGTTMIPYASERGGTLDAQQIADIVAYMRSWLH